MKKDASSTASALSKEGIVEEAAADLLFPDSFLLSAIDVFNWGPFSGRHHVEIDPQGTAIIGATGSGKTTLVDALMTLICAQPRYNLASTGGHDQNDRDWVSYVRGKSGEGNGVDDDHIARPGKTLSALAASFSDGNKRLQIGGIFWFEGSSSSLSDLKRLWFVDQRSEADLDELLERFDQGGKKALKQHQKQTADLNVADSKKAYLTQIQRFFQVGDNAFTLLNRAAGLKQLDSIDDLFRDYVLDDRSAYQRASEVVAGFDKLTTIHGELQTARRQRDSLLPIRERHAEYEKNEARQAQLHTLRELVPVWFAGQRLEWLSRQQTQLNAAKAEYENRVQQNLREQAAADQQQQDKHAVYLRVGGAGLEELRQNLARLNTQRISIAEAAAQYQRVMQRCQLESELNESVFLVNQPKLRALGEQLEAAIDEKTAPLHAAIADAELGRRKLEALTAELHAVSRRPTSNMPPEQDRYRARLAEQLGVQPAELPFLAELVEVKPEFQDWTGAIERAIGAHRLRILVPEALMPTALNWVNQRDNRLDVRLLEVSPSVQKADSNADREAVRARQQRPPFLDDGFVTRLNFKALSDDGASRELQKQQREAAKTLLAGIDRHCVDSAQALRETPHGLTREGMMSGRRGYFEKRDSTPLSHNWMTGFNNAARLAQLQASKAEAESEQKLAGQRQESLEAELAGMRAEQTLLERTGELRFEAIDLDGCDQQIQRYQGRIDAMLDPTSDTARAQADWEEAKQISADLGKVGKELHAEQRLLEEQLARIDRQRDQAQQQLGASPANGSEAKLSEEQLDWVAEQLPEAASVSPDSDIDNIEHFHKAEHAAEQWLFGELENLAKVLKRLDAALVRQMSQAKQADTGALAETGTELRDIPDYLARLRILIDEQLPEKEQRFLDYLRSSSDQSVVQLLSVVENEVATIEDRIEELNATMQAVDFQPGRYLHLVPQRVVHESIRSLEKARNHLNAARHNDDDGESHFRALQAVVELIRTAAENKRTKGSRALLDPRYRLQFSASVIERESQRVINRFSGSKSGSGGEKEIIASYILTASLSYALCPAGARRPLFGTIVLDEAFSKSSQAVAGRIVMALREFGLHPLFVTPNKEMQLLRTHTRSAVLIHRKGRDATTTSLSWEALTERAQQVRKRIRHDSGSNAQPG